MSDIKLIIKNGYPAPINAPDLPEKAATEPFPVSMLTVKDGYPTPNLAPDLPEKAATEPFTLSLWRVDKNKNGGYPFTGLMILTEPKGAFRKAEKLERVYIPESVKRIGAEAFRYTALKTVRIAPDCEYSPTSFPEGCEVEFYGGGGDYGQLYDSDGYAVLDCEAARIYVKE